MAESFQKNSVNWQLETLSRRIGEWFELHTPRSEFNPPYLPSGQWIAGAFWVIVAIATLGLLFLIYRGLRPYLESKWLQAEAFLKPRSVDPEPERSIADWIREAQHWQQQGNYQEACRALYRAMLQRLNDTQLIPYHVSLTDGEYRRRVERLPQSEAYQTLLQTHEQFQFGKVSISLEILNRCQQAYRRIEQESDYQEPDYQELKPRL